VYGLELKPLGKHFVLLHCLQVFGNVISLKLSLQAN